MANLHLKQALTAEDKMALMRQDACFDVADDEAPDFDRIQQSIRAPKGPPTAPKVFLSNDCVFNCSYCGCRRCREDKTRYASAPREFAGLCMNTARANGGRVFITSAIYKSADYTEELIIETMRILRREMGYRGYLHAKIMPGCDPELIRRAGLYANRLSVNIEVAKSEGYGVIARDKNKANILERVDAILAHRR